MEDSTKSQILEELFFSNEFEHVLDSQNRISIPSEWRQKEAETRFIMLPGGNHDLVLFPFEAFSAFLIKARNLAFANRHLQAALAKIGAKCRDCRCDKQGRIKLDRQLLDSIGVGNKVKLVGAITHIKLCDPAAWDAADNQLDDECFDIFQSIGESGGDLSSLLAGIMNK